ncbi:MAG: hypothetical protein AAF518_28075 [Spirochaetota bacterium]
MSYKNPFYIETSLRSGWQVFKYLFFEYKTLENISEPLSRQQKVVPLLRTYPYIFLVSTFFFLSIAVFITAIDLPLLYSSSYHYPNLVLTQWEQASHFLEKMAIFHYKDFFWGLLTGFYCKTLSGDNAFLPFLFTYLVFGKGNVISNVYYFCYSLFRNKLADNPYLLDSRIYLPLPIHKKLLQQAVENPTTGMQFSKRLPAAAKKTFL